MHHLKKKNSKIFSPEGPHKNVWGPRENVFPGPAVALNRPEYLTVRRGCFLRIVSFKNRNFFSGVRIVG